MWLHYRGQRTEKKKTAVKKNTLNPEFNEQFEFYIPMEKLKDYTLEIIVMDKDRIGRNECIGKVIHRYMIITMKFPSLYRLC